MSWEIVQLIGLVIIFSTMGTILIGSITLLFLDPLVPTAVKVVLGLLVVGLVLVLVPMHFLS